MTRSRSALLALLGGIVAAGIVGVVTHFSSGRFSSASAPIVGVVLAVAFYLRSRRAAGSSNPTQQQKTE